MPTKRLTDLFVEQVKMTPSGRVEYFDAAFPALALRVGAKAKAWSLFYRVNGKLRRHTLGAYPDMRPADARKAAADALQRLKQGIDPAQEKRAPKPVVGRNSFEAVAREYLERYVARNTAPATLRETRRILERDVIPVWGSRAIADITKRDVIDLLDTIGARGAEVQANRTLARLRTLFGWAVDQDRLAVAPTDRLKPPSRERPRDRVLSDAELRWFWHACVEAGWPFGPLFQLLILTGQRRDEVGGMQWAELDFASGLWTIPKERAKNGRAHVVHLAPSAVAILQDLPRVSERFVFTTNGETAASGFSRAKQRVDAATERQAGGAVADFILHDLRRTAATGMAGLRVPPQVVDKILNHVSGTIRGVAAIYNKHEYGDERREALLGWAGRISQLIDAPTGPDEVVRPPKMAYVPKQFGT